MGRARNVLGHAVNDTNLPDSTSAVNPDPPSWAVCDLRGPPPPSSVVEGGGGGPKHALGYVCISARGVETDLGVRVRQSRQGGRPGASRGRITAFSVASGRRLRRLILERDGPAGWRPFSWTATLPGPPVSPDEWRRVWHAFRCRMARIGWPLIWRVELQRRKQPHVHGIGWLPAVEAAGRSREASGILDLVEVRGAWVGAVRVLGEYRGAPWGKLGIVQADDRMSFPGADLRAFFCTLDQGRDPARWWRYLAAHSSKRKGEQLGWHGRQWGVINGGLLRRADSETLAVRRRDLVRVVRQLRKLVHLRRASARGRQSWFARPEDVRRLVGWATEGRAVNVSSVNEGSLTKGGGDER